LTFVKLMEIFPKVTSWSGQVGMEKKIISLASRVK